MFGFKQEEWSQCSSCAVDDQSAAVEIGSCHNTASHKFMGQLSTILVESCIVPLTKISVSLFTRFTTLFINIKETSSNIVHKILLQTRKFINQTSFEWFCISAWH